MESELINIEKLDLGNNYSEEAESVNHLKEIDHLTAEMEKILGTEAFISPNGRSKI